MAGVKIRVGRLPHGDVYASQSLRCAKTSLPKVCVPSSHPYPPLVLISTPQCITGLRSKRFSANAGTITVTLAARVAAPSQTLPIVDGGWGGLQAHSITSIGYHLVFRPDLVASARAPTLNRWPRRVALGLGRGTRRVPLRAPI